MGHAQGFHEQRHARQRRSVVHGETQVLLGQAVLAAAVAVHFDALPEEVPR